MKRNARLLNKTADRIEKIPESYEQSVFFARSDGSPCGTVACLAGEIIICSAASVELGIKKLQDEFLPDVSAARLVGFTRRETGDLFNSTARCWPSLFKAQYNRAKSLKGRAKVAAGLLRYLAKGGKV